jgi:FKBP-type peptidyl-prolyl cis-trans isomerase SlyD
VRAENPWVIATNKVVRIDYTLRNAAGDVLDSSEGERPLAYIHGRQEIVPGLEKELTGLAVGDSKKVVVPPSEGYGERVDEQVFPIPRAAFPPGVAVEVGQTLIGEGDGGERVPVRVIEVRDDSVIVDANHPLAGETLYFEITIREVRDATPDELVHGVTDAD